MYDLAFRVGGEGPRRHDASPLSSRLARPGGDITIVATSIMVLEALRAADHLADVSDIDCEVIDLNCVSHIDETLVLDSLKKTGRLMIADTSWQSYGVCAEICRIVSENCPSALKAPVVTLGMQPAPCPTGKTLEDLFYPNLEIMVNAIAGLVVGTADHGLPLPDEHSMADVYKRFKGPF